MTIDSAIAFLRSIEDRVSLDLHRERGLPVYAVVLEEVAELLRVATVHGDEV